MKKYITPFLFTCCMFLLSQEIHAQANKASVNPANSQSKPTQENAVPPAAPNTQKKIEQQNYKPIVPGGEFKPEAAKGMIPSTAVSAKQETYTELKPALPVTYLVTPVPEKQVKKADPVPAIQKQQ